MEFFHHAESWVLVSFLLFVGLLIYLKVPKIVGRVLDEHSFKVSSQLDEARKLRDEAAQLLADYKKKIIQIINHLDFFKSIPDPLILNSDRNMLA